MLFFSVTEHPRALTYNHNNSGLRSQDVTHKHLTFNRALMWEINADENETIPSYIALMDRFIQPLVML